MPTPDPHGSGQPATARPRLSGYEVTDASVPGDRRLPDLRWPSSAWSSLSSAFGIGKVINTAIVKHDGPLNKWNAAGSRVRLTQEEHGLRRGHWSKRNCSR